MELCRVMGEAIEDKVCTNMSSCNSIVMYVCTWYCVWCLCGWHMYVWCSYCEVLSVMHVKPCNGFPVLYMVRVEVSVFLG